MAEAIHRAHEITRRIGEICKEGGKLSVLCVICMLLIEFTYAVVVNSGGRGETQGCRCRRKQRSEWHVEAGISRRQVFPRVRPARGGNSLCGSPRAHFPFASLVLHLKLTSPSGCIRTGQYQQKHHHSPPPPTFTVEAVQYPHTLPKQVSKVRGQIIPLFRFFFCVCACIVTVVVAVPSL